LSKTIEITRQQIVGAHNKQSKLAWFSVSLYTIEVYINVLTASSRFVVQPNDKYKCSPFVCENYSVTLPRYNT